MGLRPRPKLEYFFVVVKRLGQVCCHFGETYLFRGKGGRSLRDFGGLELAAAGLRSREVRGYHIVVEELLDYHAMDM